MIEVLTTRNRLSKIRLDALKQHHKNLMKQMEECELL